MLKEIYGDILTPVTTGEATVVCHQVNCRGVMGAGLAKQIKDRFPGVYRAYRGRCAAHSSQDNLGTVQYCSALADAGYIIANVFGQDGYGTRKVQTDYNALRKAFADIAIAFHDDVIRIPYKMGCGLAGGNWDTVRRLIEEELVPKVKRVEIWRLR